MNFGKKNEKLRKKINDLAPDFILVAGDIINKSEICYPSNAFSLLEELASTYKIYYAYGNHEQKAELIFQDKEEAEKSPSGELLGKSWKEYKEQLVKRGVIFLNNESTSFEKNGEKLLITGVSIAREFFRRTDIPKMEQGYLRSLLGEKNASEFRILIAHNPVYFSEYTKWGADLTVSGHLHGGLVRLPVVGGIISPQVRLFPKYSAGIFTENGKQMIVSRGLGSHSLMPRIFNRPEIVSIVLKRDK
jgi:Predicted phosphohydrolases